MKHKIACLVVFSLISFPATAANQLFVFEQGVGGYSGFEDTSIFSDLVNSGGGTDGVFSGTNNQLDERRALIRADLTSIPTGSTVLSVSLQMTVELSGASFGDIDYTLHPLSTDWGEGTVVGLSAGGFGGPADIGDATWSSNFHTTSLWTSAGGDFSVSASATAAAGLADTNVIWNSAGLVNDVQLWLDSPASNHGWMLISALEGSKQRIKKFKSSEAASNRPVLTILVQLPPGPPAAPASYPLFQILSFLMVPALGVMGIGKFRAYFQ
jgi:hypothetical protein